MDYKRRPPAGCARICIGNMPPEAAQIRRSKRQSKLYFVVYYNDKAPGCEDDKPAAGSFFSFIADREDLFALKVSSCDFGRVDLSHRT